MISPRFLAVRAIRSLGFDIRRVANPAKLPIEPSGTDPVTLEYCLSKRGYAILDIPLEQCRAFHSLGLRLRREDHPFVRAFEKALNSPTAVEAKAEIEKVLGSYYDSVRPNSAVEMVGLSEDQVPGLRQVAPIGYVLPWWESSIDETTRGREKSLNYVAKRVRINTPVDGGHTFFGPVPPARLAVQVLRLYHLLASVRSRGFHPFARDFPTKVVALRQNGLCRWLIEEGQHRFALGAALGVRSIAAVVTSVVRREDAEYWPQVVRGVFTEAGALTSFDRIFEGIPAPACRGWIDRLEL